MLHKVPFPRSLQDFFIVNVLHSFNTRGTEDPKGEQVSQLIDHPPPQNQNLRSTVMDIDISKLKLDAMEPESVRCSCLHSRQEAQLKLVGDTVWDDTNAKPIRGSPHS